MNDLEAASTPADDGSTGHIEEYGIKSLPPAVVDAEKGEKDALAAQQEEEKGRIAAFLGNIRSLSTKNVENLNPIHQASVYAANPFTNSILFILALDFLERFAYYGVIFTMPGYLTGYYEPLWNPDFAPFQANGFIAMSQGIGFITPFFTALVADVLIGDYWSINFFTGLCYIPGLILVAVCAIPYAGDLTHFPLENLKIGTHILFPLGFGAAKTLYGVYAAKQYDPIHHADQIEKFFVIFTGVEFIGSFLGGAISIIIADLLKQPRSGLIIAEFINVGALAFGLIIFLLGSGRYMKDKLMRKTYGQMFRSLFEAILCFGGSGKGCAFPGFSKTKQSKGGRVQDSVVDGMVQVILLFPVFLLILPNNVAFTQAVVINITTTSYMKGFGVFKGPMLVATSLLFIGLWAFLMKRYLAPFLQKKGIKLSIADRFALGSFFLGCSYAISAIMSYEIKRAYLETGSQVNIFYGLFGTFLSGGVAFHFSAMNESKSLNVWYCSVIALLETHTSHQNTLPQQLHLLLLPQS